eukprot:CAMPEP_0202703132 /NCGR_PEP_ID=MMETSP1385-20130828/16016_1 /ASSEMBLY_ACC=CAM_ASM_000861 /TAXON_ID=933848 /ORGANISM="Elphidium margaritaceum" /LENGTH=185 /DNA_ID=CAMNT_0049360925 /DNA_START=59 /DNA_END=616 /DNA_ORIENTATION=-
MTSHVLAFECGGSDAQPISPFDVEEYLGVWYQIAVTHRFEQFFERDMYCVYANYSRDASDANKIVVVNTGYKGGPDGEKKSVVGSATLKHNNTGQLSVSFGGPPGPYWIIKMLTDQGGKYSTAVVWSCEHVFGISFGETLWILSRTRTIPDVDYQSLVQYAQSVNINATQLDLINTEQTNCQPVH